MLTIRKLVILSVVALLALVVQACGGGGAGDVAPTVTAVPLPSADGAAPGGPPQGFRGGGQFAGIAEPDQDLAAFFGLSLAELEGELDVEGANLGKIADATGRSREELQSFLLDRAEAAFAEGDGQGGNFPGNQDFLTVQLPAIINNIIDGEGFGGGNFPDGFRRGNLGAPDGFGGLLGLDGDNEELAAFLGLSADELGELVADHEATLADVATDNEVSREELFNFLLAQAESNIANAVSDGTLAQENADQFLDGLADTINAFIDSSGFEGFGQRPFGDHATPEASE